MTLKGVLLAGAALVAVSAVPALAKTAPNIHVLAMQPGAVVKTAMHHGPASNLTYTFSVTTGVTLADFKVKTNLAKTFYTWLSNDSICQQPKKEKVVLATKKTLYAKLGTATETYSEGCSAPDKFYGDTYELKTKKGKNKTDKFVSTLEATFHNEGTKYKGKLNLDVSVAITK